MRTTVTLDADTRLLVERLMNERDLSFKQAVNHAIRLGLQVSGTAAAGYTSPRKMGPARVDVVKALALAADLEVDAISRRLIEGR